MPVEKSDGEIRGEEALRIAEENTPPEPAELGTDLNPNPAHGTNMTPEDGGGHESGMVPTDD